MAATKANRIAFFKSTQLSGGITDLTNGSTLAFDWSNSQNYDPEYFSYAGGTPTRLVFKKAGDYLIAINVPQERTDATTGSRTRTQIEIRKNGSASAEDVGVGRSSYIRNNSTAASGHRESSNHLFVMLKDMAVDDYIEVFNSRLTNVSGLTVNITGAASIYAEYVEDKTVFFGTGTQLEGGTDLNPAIEDDFEWSAEVRKDSGYTHSTGTNPEDITLDAQANYFLAFNIPLSGAQQDANPRGRVLLQGALIPGGHGKQGFIRNTNSDTQSSIHYAGVVRTTGASQVVKIALQAEANTGTAVTIGSHKGTVYIEKLPSTDVYFGEATTLDGGLTDWSPSSKTGIDWNTDRIIDTNVYSHSTGSNQHQITVLKPGDYLLAFNGAWEGAIARSNIRITVEVDGTPVTGAEAKDNYIRNRNNHTEASSALIFLLESLTAGQVITVSAEVEATNGTLNDSTPATLMLRRVYTEQTKTVTAKANITPYVTTQTKTIQAKANLLAFVTTEKTVTAKANIICIEKVTLVSPTHQSTEQIPITFVWTIPNAKTTKKVGAHLQIDDTSSAFGSIEIEKQSHIDSGFEYWNGSGWVSYPVEGVSSAYFGNQARIELSPSSGLKYWRVRGILYG